MKNNMILDFTKPRLNINLNPWQITGITDGDGGFFVSILTNDSKNVKTRIRVKLEFKVTPTLKEYLTNLKNTSNVVV